MITLESVARRYGDFTAVDHVSFTALGPVPTGCRSRRHDEIAKTCSSSLPRQSNRSEAVFDEIRRRPLVLLRADCQQDVSKGRLGTRPLTARPRVV
jgi:hypothetical protein